MRKYVEFTFMVVKKNVFHKTLQAALAFVEDIIKICCLLHNLVQGILRIPCIVKVFKTHQPLNYTVKKKLTIIFVIHK
jgi:hypothetical protein